MCEEEKEASFAHFSSFVFAMYSMGISTERKQESHEQSPIA
jgi:hypothetical protein